MSWLVLLGVVNALEFAHVRTVGGGGHRSKVAATADDRSAEFVSTYRSSPIALDGGRVVLSDPATTLMEMPTGDWWLRGIELEVVNASGASVPLSEVYLHHIAVYDSANAGADVCGGASLDSRDSIWAVGAESRGTRTFFPDGAGYRVYTNSTWSANIHLIRSEGVQNVKRCIECSGPGGGGSEAFCGDGTQCAGLVLPPKDYFVQYDVYYDRTAVNVPITYRTLDVAACQLEFNVPALCPWTFRSLFDRPEGSLVGSGRFFPFDFVLDPEADLPNTCVATRSWSMTWPWDDALLVFGKGHLHIGSLDMSLYRRTTRDNNRTTNTASHDELLCKVVPKYGQVLNWPLPETPGDEAGYVVGISNCDDAFKRPPTVRRGDVLTVRARYRAQPWYDGVMALFDIAAVDATTSLGF